MNTLIWLLLTLFVLGALTLILVPGWLTKPSRKPLKKRAPQDFETADEFALVPDKQGDDSDHSLLSRELFQGKLTALVCSPNSLYVYWDGTYWPEGDLMLSLYEMRGYSGVKIQELPLYYETDNWYFRDLNSNTLYWAEIGIISPLGEYSRLLTSDKVVTPRDTVSTKIDPQWEPLAGLNFGFGVNVQSFSSSSLRKD